jgi:sugar O-acyltransferase (sialic acid O-acetyltransferase NeuD family)
MKTIVILGAGGMAREIEWLIRDLNRIEETYKFIGFAVSELSKIGPNDSREQIVGDYDWLVRNRASIDAVAVGVGTPAVRLKLAGEVACILPGAEWPALVHPTAIIDDETAKLSQGVQICARVIATINITLEAYALCNFGCTLGHEVSVGEGSVINPGANVGGGVSVGRCVLVGTGAQILQYRKIGNNAIVGAGAVVTRNVSEDTTVVGIPAKVLSSNWIPEVSGVAGKQ